MDASDVDDDGFVTEWIIFVLDSLGLFLHCNKVIRSITRNANYY
jgi:hypothetical protein